MDSLPKLPRSSITLNNINASDLTTIYKGALYIAAHFKYMKQDWVQGRTCLGQGSMIRSLITVFQRYVTWQFSVKLSFTHFSVKWILPIFPSFQAKLVLWNPHVYDLGSTLRPYSNRISSTSRRTSSWSSCIWSSQRYGNLSLLRLHRQISARLPSVFVCEKVFTDFVQYCICFYLNTYYKVSTDIIIYKVFLKSVVFNKISNWIVISTFVVCVYVGTYTIYIIHQTYELGIVHCFEHHF